MAARIEAGDGTNVGVQPPPKAVGWNNRLELSRPSACNRHAAKDDSKHQPQDVDELQAVQQFATAKPDDRIDHEKRCRQTQETEQRPVLLLRVTEATDQDGRQAKR